MASADDAPDGAEAAEDIDVPDDSDIAEASEDSDLVEDTADADDDAPRPRLQQRFSPFARVTTTLHPQGLVIQVDRTFRQRTAAVSFERLVLDPTTIVSLRAGLLWTAGGLCAGGVLAALPAAPAAAALIPALPAAALNLLRFLSPALLVAGILALLAAATHPRRVTLFLDREAGLHPSFLRGGPEDGEVADFVQLVQRAIIDYRCRPPDTGEGAPPRAPRLAATLDALLAMQREELLTDPELAHFRELALRR